MNNKKLIELGWDVPSLDFFATNYVQMQQKPFDGITFRLEHQPDQSNTSTPVAAKEGRQTVFKTTSYDETEFKSYYDLARNLKGLPGHHFLLVWASPDEGWHWFDEQCWRHAEHNLRLFARVVREGGFEGIVFDPESYVSLHPWRYSSIEQAFGSRYSYADTCQRIRYCGARTMEILQEECPDITVLMLYLLAQIPIFQPFAKLPERLQVLANQEFGMLPYFLAGMLETAQGNTKIIDGNELAYYHTQRQQYELDARRIRGDLRLQLADFIGEGLPNYDKHLQVGFASYYDYLINPNHFDAWYVGRHRYFGNYLSHEERLLWLEHNTYYALSHCDEFSWWYSESMDWWRGGITPGVEEIVQKARDAVRQDKAFTKDEILSQAIKRARLEAETKALQLSGL